MNRHILMQKEFSQHINNCYAECLKKVQNLAQGIDAEFAFLTLILELTIFCNNNPDNDVDISSALIELAAFHLYPRFGKNGSRDKTLLEEFNKSLQALNAIRGLHAHRGANADTTALSSIQSALLVEEEIVRGERYPIQTEKYIKEIQGPFELWFKEKTGIGPKRALSIVSMYEKIMTHNLENFRAQFLQDQTLDTDKLIELLFPNYAQFITISPDLTQNEWEAFKKLIGMTPNTCVDIENPRDMKNYPLYCLSKDRIAFFNLPVTYDALFNAFENVTRNAKEKESHDKIKEFHDKVYEPKRSKWLEEEVYTYCCRIFQPENVYKNLKYPDPKKKKSERALDITIFCDPFLIFFEIKGARFKPKSRIGKIAHLRSDLKDNVEEAFEQSLTAIRYIDESQEIATFVEKKSRRTLEIKKEKFLKIFPINVTLHRFSHLTTQLGRLKPLGLFQGNSYPWSVSIADLDVITRFAGTVEVFLHFIHRRLELQHTEMHISSDELDLFACYLDSRLELCVSEPKDENRRPINMLLLTGYTQKFDEWYEADMIASQKPIIEMNLPPKFKEILKELRHRNDVSTRWIAFTLLSLSQEAIDCIEKHLKIIKEKTRANQRFLTLRFKDRDTAVILISSKGNTTEEMEKQGRASLVLEKYRLQALNAIAIGVDVSNDLRPFEYAFWFEQPWAFDQQLEEMLKAFDSTESRKN